MCEACLPNLECYYGLHGKGGEGSVVILAACSGYDEDLEVQTEAFLYEYSDECGIS